MFLEFNFTLGGIREKRCYTRKKKNSQSNHIPAVFLVRHQNPFFFKKTPCIIDWHWVLLFFFSRWTFRHQICFRTLRLSPYVSCISFRRFQEGGTNCTVMAWCAGYCFVRRRTGRAYELYIRGTAPGLCYFYFIYYFVRGSILGCYVIRVLMNGYETHATEEEKEDSRIYLSFSDNQ